MSNYRVLPALCALAVIMLVGCNQPPGLPNNRVRAATVQMESCYVAANVQSGHIDWYQGVRTIWDHYDWSYPTITRAHYWAPYISPPPSPRIAWPHTNGYCVFTIPHFEAVNGVVACTLYYYQTAHFGSADLLVNSWDNPLTTWPPAENDSILNLLYWQIWNSYDTVAYDGAHGTDNCWYKVALTPDGYNAIADTAAAYPGGGTFNTGWVYRGSVDSTYTDVAGYDLDHPPFIKIWYDDGQ